VAATTTVQSFERIFQNPEGSWRVTIREGGRESAKGKGQAMRKILLGVGLAALAVLGATNAAAQSSTAWLHVRVEEARDSSKVSVNLPLSVVEAVLKSSPELLERHGHIHIGDTHGLKMTDLRRAWKELAAVGDAELVSVESDDQNVKVMRKGDLVQVFVDHKPRAAKAAKEVEKADKGDKAEKAEKPEKADKGRGGETVRIEVPVSLVDALLSGDGDEANVEAAILELKKRRGDIVRVQDDDNHVRIWIDEQNTQAPPSGK
jgi:hypothetical protein